MENIDDLFKRVEEALETGSYVEALSLAEQAIIASVEQNLPDKCVNALGHKLIVYKHLFQQREDLLYNELMYGDIQTGMAICKQYKLFGQPLAVMLTRLGDYYVHKEQYMESVPHYEAAFMEISEASKGKFGELAEYLSHLGLARVMAGQEQGLKDVEQALALANQDMELRAFHKLIITSGILFRLAAIYGKRGDVVTFNQYFEKAMKEAEELKSEYSMPMRIIQGERLKTKLGIV